MSYISNPNCIILAVTSANTDMATSEALKLAKVVDPDGEIAPGFLSLMSDFPISLNGDCQRRPQDVSRDNQIRSDGCWDGCNRRPVRKSHSCQARHNRNRQSIATGYSVQQSEFDVAANLPDLIALHVILFPVFLYLFPQSIDEALKDELLFLQKKYPSLAARNGSPFLAKTLNRVSVPVVQTIPHTGWVRFGSKNVLWGSLNHIQI